MPDVGALWAEAQRDGGPLVRVLSSTSAATGCMTHDGTTRLPRDASGTGDSHVDPLNRHPFRFPADPRDPSDRDSWASLLELPATPAESWSRPRPGGVVVEECTLPSGRRVAVHRPPGV